MNQPEPIEEVLPDQRMIQHTWKLPCGCKLSHKVRDKGARDFATILPDFFPIARKINCAWFAHVHERHRCDLVSKANPAGLPEGHYTHINVPLGVGEAYPA